jgi:lysophospholipase L1-like esterase/pimeloyl-ACP methyl ester carboxylesterase
MTGESNVLAFVPRFLDNRNVTLRLCLGGICFLLPFLVLGSPAPIRVACMGNSITYGAGIVEREISSFPARLQALLGEKYLVKNFGKSGATLLGKGDVPYACQGEFRNALSFLPQIVFIGLGTNDSKPQNRTRLTEFEHDYGTLIDTLRAIPSKPRIILLLPPPAYSNDVAGITKEVIEAEILPRIRAVAYTKGCEVINLYNLLLDRPEWFPDGVHPSATGAAAIASRLYELLTMETDSAFSLLPAPGLQGTFSNYYGFDCFSFHFDGRDAKIVRPKRAAKGRPWIWRARFWGHEPQTEIALLERGFHLVYCDVAELFGNDEATGLWERFYNMLVGAGLSRRAVLEGFSRGGIYVYRWAVTHPDRVSCVYVDAPVLDVKSWPGGKRKSPGNPEEWELFKKDFGLLSEAEALAFNGDPMDLAPEIARKGFPMLHVVGDADETVPVDENTNPFERIVRSHGGNITVIHKPGIGHHPHSLPNPQVIVDFILRSTIFRREVHDDE